MENDINPPDYCQECGTPPRFGRQTCSCRDPWGTAAPPQELQPVGLSVDDWPEGKEMDVNWPTTED